MKKELYINTCSDCRLSFRTDKQEEHLCPSCLKFRAPNKKKRSKKRKKEPMTFAEVLRIANIYSNVHHKYIHYGDMVALLDKNSDRCVCCGEVVPEGRQVCPQCEKAGGL